METKLKILSYNIDGLPEKLNLKELPWQLKPIAWIYELIKGTTEIKINDNSDKDKDTEAISKYLLLNNFDLIGVQEDFNFHDKLLTHIKELYNCGTHLGGFELSKVISNTEITSYFPRPRFKVDGINLISKKNRITVNKEDIVCWDKSYGYLDHANDLLTHKGFRFYDITIDNYIDVDVYIVHMDADFYNPEKHTDVTKDVKTRKEQINQLLSYIFDKYVENKNKFGKIKPVIIMGDTNSYNKYEWDKENIKYLVDSINYFSKLHCKEAIPSNYDDCDRLFIINHEDADYRLEINSCEFNMTMQRYSDHYPLEITINIIKN
jgi:hypothetical protein